MSATTCAMNGEEFVLRQPSRLKDMTPFTATPAHEGDPALGGSSYPHAWGEIDAGD